MFRPITLWPFPAEGLERAASNVHSILTVELSNGQMVEDVRGVINGRVPVEFYGRVGGNVPSVLEIRDVVAGTVARHAHFAPHSLTETAEKARAKPLTAEVAENAEQTDERYIDLFSTVV